MKERVVIATRESPLALWQANFVKARLEEAHPGLRVELLGMRTQGDRWLSTPLSEVGGKGLFIKELEQALLDGRADIAVHTMKDVPAELEPEFTLAAGHRGWGWGWRWTDASCQPRERGQQAKHYNQYSSWKSEFGHSPPYFPETI